MYLNEFWGSKYVCCIAYNRVQLYKISESEQGGTSVVVI